MDANDSIKNDNDSSSQRYTMRRVDRMILLVRLNFHAKQS